MSKNMNKEYLKNTKQEGEALELLKKTELLLFSLEPKEARKLKDKTISLLNDWVVSKEEHLALAHQINQIRKIKKNFLSWLECYCSCEECKEN